MASDPDRRQTARGVVAAAAAYVAISIALTWPLVLGVTHDVPSDFGDPLLNSWILAWDAEHLLRAATGHPGALAGYWHANIYYPHPYALAYSEHLTGVGVPRNNSLRHAVRPLRAKRQMDSGLHCYR